MNDEANRTPLRPETAFPFPVPAPTFEAVLTGPRAAQRMLQARIDRATGLIDGTDQLTARFLACQAVRAVANDDEPTIGGWDQYLRELGTISQRLADHAATSYRDKGFTVCGYKRVMAEQLQILEAGERRWQAFLDQERRKKIRLVKPARKRKAN
jgi:hypothetical protein